MVTGCLVIMSLKFVDCSFFYSYRFLKAVFNDCIKKQFADSWHTLISFHVLFSNSHHFFHFLTQHTFQHMQVRPLPSTASTTSLKQTTQVSLSENILYCERTNSIWKSMKPFTHSPSQPEFFKTTKNASSLSFCSWQKIFDITSWYPSILWFTKQFCFKMFLWAGRKQFLDLCRNFLSKEAKVFCLVSKFLKKMLMKKFFSLKCSCRHVEFCLKACRKIFWEGSWFFSLNGRKR